MARMIYKQDSTAMHLKMARRHIRLCGQVKGAGKFAEQILPVWKNLKESEKKKESASEIRDDAYDDVVLKDIELDNMVRTVFERTRQYDRDNTTRYLDLLFPARGFSDIIRMHMSKEPQEVGKLLLKIEKLEDGHGLRELIEPLKTKIENAKAAWAAYEQKIDSLKEMQIDEEMAKLAVRRQYEHNWLDARKEYGVNMADSIFPKITTRKKVNGDDDEESITDDDPME